MTKIKLITDGITCSGALNETIAARDFAKRLPFTATCRRNDTEYYCSSANGIFEPMELQIGYKAGDIVQWNGWFFIAYQDAAQEYQRQLFMVIGRLDAADKLKTESGSIKITVQKQED